MTNCVWARFRIGSHAMPGQRHSQPSDFVGSRMYVCLGVTFHLHFCKNDRGLLRATAVTRGWNGHRLRVSTQNWLWKWKLSRRSCRDSNSQPFDHESGAVTNKLSRLPALRIGYSSIPPLPETSSLSAMAELWGIEETEIRLINLLRAPIEWLVLDTWRQASREGSCQVETKVKK